MTFVTLHFLRTFLSVYLNTRYFSGLILYYLLQLRNGTRFSRFSGSQRRYEALNRVSFQKRQFLRGSKRTLMLEIPCHFNVSLPRRRTFQ